MLSLPQNEQIEIKDMQLWLIFCTWENWIVKSKPIQHLRQDYQGIIQMKYIYPPRTADVPLDKYFAESTHEKTISATVNGNSLPKLEMPQDCTQNLYNTYYKTTNSLFKVNIFTHLEQHTYH